LESQESKIDECVYEDTKDQHQEKHRIDNLVDDLDKEIEAIEAQLVLKKKERDMFVLERSVYDK